MTLKLATAAAIAAGIFALAAVRAQNAPAPATAPTAAQPDTAPDQLDLGSIMASQQERHIKLWFAGQAGNWPLADYEVGKLEDGFDDAGKLLGGDIVDNVVGAPLKALEKVVADKNRAGFPAAFDNLTAGCNNCHQMLDHRFISIQRPNLLPYSDQSFAPQK